MNPALGGALAVLAIAVGYVGYGWPGVLLGVTVIVFWLLLQFSRVMRAMRLASQRPLGRIDNAVMLNARLSAGMRLIEILPLTKSLGTRLGDEPETFAWIDGGGDSVEIELVRGRLSRWQLKRLDEGAAAARPAGMPGTSAIAATSATSAAFAASATPGAPESPQAPS